ncbi:MAG: hypothetical protein E7479_05655 [Ruminococcaceae bacterium]|nr:hypothetical protein [Oscillospiraceae bacterium]
MPLKIIYADILLAINLAVDYLVLFGTARLAGIRFVRIKGILAAGIGAIYSLVILFDFPGIVFAATKLAVSALMIFVSFGKRKAGEFLRLLLIFYICGLLFSGFMMLINSAAKEESFFVKGGIVYFEFSAMGIVLSGTAAFVLTEIFRRILNGKNREGASVAKVFFGGKYSVLKVLVDTGNNLSDPFSGTPVAVASPESLEKILPEKVLSELKKNNLSTDFCFRYIPCKTISGSVLIPSIKPEKVIVESGGAFFEAEEILIGISGNAPENTLIIGKNVVYKE